MAAPSNEGTERKTDRLEAFSDAVLAIAITVPVVELHAPKADHGRLLAAYLDLAPDYAAYVVSVVVIGLYWAHSHFGGKILLKTDHVFNLLSVGFLAAVSLTPFPARPLFEHVMGDGDSRTAALVFLGVLATPSTWWLTRWLYAVAKGLPDPTLEPRYLRRLSLKYAITVVAYWSAFGLAFFSWQTGLALAAATTLGYLVPPMAPAFREGQKPADELEEADEKRG